MIYEKTKRFFSNLEKCDYHLHTTASDGDYGPRQTVRRAKEIGLTTIAITDHDTISSVVRAQAEGEKQGINVIAGVEITSRNRYDAHILGYFFDDSYKGIETELQKSRLLHTERTGITAERMGVGSIDCRIGGGKYLSLAHLARALVENGNYPCFEDANIEIQKHKPPYLPGSLTQEEAIKLIKKYDGVAVLAHPGKIKTDDHESFIVELIQYGLEGLEINHPCHNAEQVKYFSELADKYGLIKTAGSDYHGPIISPERAIGKTMR